MWGTAEQVGDKIIGVVGLPLFLLAAAISAGEPDNAQIQRAFAVASAGFSSDELLLQDDLRDRFLRLLAGGESSQLDADSERAALLKLLKLRKAGKLKPKATRRGKPVEAWITPIAEIAARVVTDRHRVTSDTMLADPKLRAELQEEAEKIQSGVDAYSVRKAVLQLRKKRALRPELVLQVADWEREIKTYALDDLRSRIQTGQVPEQPGIYLFRNATGYLYIGEAENLCQRLKEHLGGSDRKSLADFLASDVGDAVTVELHLFPAESPAKKITVRRAYESELIRSRNPKFNVRP